MELIIVQRIFSNYRKPIFDKIAGAYDLRLVHTSNKSGIEQATADYAKNVPSWHYGKKETNQFLWLFPELLTFKPKAVIHEMALGMPTMFLTLWLKKLLGFKFILWGHGYDRKIGFHPEGKLGDKIRLYLMKGADAVLLYDQNTKKLLSQHLNESKIFVAPNTLDTEGLNTIRKELEKKGRVGVCNELNWATKFNLVYIGRLLESKHPDKLFEIVSQLPIEFRNDVTIHIIGSGPEEIKLKEQVKQLSDASRFVFYGAVHDAFETGKMLYAADLMIIPGAVGLSVNHAFAFDCPVATFLKSNEGPHHGPEIEYVIADKTGLVAPAYKVDLLANEIIEYLKDSDQQTYMRKQVRELLRSKATIDKMLQGFDEVITYTNSQLQK